MSEDKGLAAIDHQREITTSLAALDVNIAPGDQFIDADGRIYQVVEFDYAPKESLVYVRMKCEDWSGISGYKLHENFAANGEGKRHFVKLDGRLEDITLLAQQAMLNPSLLDPDSGNAKEETIAGNVTALTTSTISRAQIESYQKAYQMAADRAAMLERVIKRKMSAISAMTRKMRVRIGYLSAVLSVAESFMGVYESITTIKDGTPAPFETPIHIIQGCLWMDEEVGDVELRHGNQIGIDFASVEVFDEWLTKDEHWKNIVPHPKCIVALKPSRQIRDYGDPYANTFLGVKNKALYILIRNGEKLHRIWTGLTDYEDGLFPLLDEWRKLQKEVEEAYQETEFFQKKVKEVKWIERVALLQGLIVRTDVLAPTPDINLFGEKDYEEGRVVLIRDLEQNYLPDGRLSYDAWHKQINATLRRGSRVLLAQMPYRYSSKGESDWQDRFSNQFWRHHPSLPAPGVYLIEEEVKPARYMGHKGRAFKILYLPDDNVWRTGEDGWPEYGERKNRVSFTIYERDWFCLAYDEISLEDVEFYIGRRVERRKYQQILPTLYQVFRERTAEKAQEAEFVAHFAAIEGFAESDVWEAVSWWKYKTLYKRPLLQDDAKAWRMIRRRLKSS